MCCAEQGRLLAPHMGAEFCTILEPQKLAGRVPGPSLRPLQRGFCRTGGTRETYVTSGTEDIREALRAAE